jgi:hypothetical protein
MQTIESCSSEAAQLQTCIMLDYFRGILLQLHLWSWKATGKFVEDGHGTPW